MTGHIFETGGPVPTLSYIIGEEAPPIALWLRNDQGALIDLSTGYEVSVLVKRGGTTLLTKESGFTVGAGSGTSDDGVPNLLIEWTDGELDAVLPNAGLYVIEVWLNNEDDDTDRNERLLLRWQMSGAATWTYGNDPAGSTLDRIRFLIGDTQDTDQLASDQELQWLLSEHGVYPGAARACLAIAARFARCMDRSTGSLSRSYSQKFQHYRELATQLEEGQEKKLALPFAGGYSRAQKDARKDDIETVPSAFQRGQFSQVGELGTMGNTIDERYDR